MYIYPFKDKLTIELHPSIAIKNGLMIKIYDAAGRLVRKLNQNGHEPAIVWHGDDDSGQRLSNGIYFLQMTLNDELITKKALMVR